jgi:hypothetical protein
VASLRANSVNKGEQENATDIDERHPDNFHAAVVEAETCPRPDESGKESGKQRLENGEAAGK